MWLLWEGDYKMLKKYLHHWLNKQIEWIRNEWRKTTYYIIVSQKPYNENGYVKLGTYNSEIVKVLLILLQFWQIKLN